MVWLFIPIFFLFLRKSEKITKVWEGKDLAPKVFPKSLILLKSFCNYSFTEHLLDIYYMPGPQLCAVNRKITSIEELTHLIGDLR